MSYETKKRATRRAKRLKFPKSSVVKSKKKGYFIAPRGITKKSAKKAYAESRARGKSKSSAAKIAHYVQKKSRRKNPVNETDFIYNNLIQQKENVIMNHVHSDTRQNAYNTLREINDHLNKGNVRNAKHIQMLHAMADHATNTLRNLDDIERNDRIDDRRSDIRRSDDRTRGRTSDRYSDETNRTVNDALDAIERILPHLDDKRMDDAEMRRGVPGTGRGRRRRTHAEMDWDDINSDRYDDDMDDYNTNARRGRVKPGPARDRRLRNAADDYNDNDTDDRVLEAYRRGHEDARRMDDRRNNDRQTNRYDDDRRRNDDRNDRYDRNERRSDTNDRRGDRTDTGDDRNDDRTDNRIVPSMKRT